MLHPGEKTTICFYLKRLKKKIKVIGRFRIRMKNRGEILVNKTLNRLALHEVLKKTVDVYAILTYYSSRSEHGRCKSGKP